MVMVVMIRHFHRVRHFCLVRRFCLVCLVRRFLAAAPKNIMGNFLLLLLLLHTPSPQPLGPYPSLEAQIPVLRPKSHPQGPNPNPKAQIPVPRDLGLKTGIWVSRLEYGPPG